MAIPSGSAAPPGSPRTGAAAPERERLCRVILERGYRRSEEPFVLSSGGTSHDYVDLRRALSRGPDLGLAAALVVELARARVGHFDAAGGLTMGADPLAHAVALHAGCEWFSVRKEPKSHGSRQRIEGAELLPGRDVLLLEDTASTGKSSLEALDAVSATGAQVVLACALLDRAGVAEDALAARGVPFLAVLTFRDLGIDPIDFGAVAGPAPAATHDAAARAADPLPRPD